VAGRASCIKWGDDRGGGTVEPNELVCNCVVSVDVSIKPWLYVQFIACNYCMQLLHAIACSLLHAINCTCNHV